MKWIACALALVLASSSAFSLDRPPQPLRDKGKKSIQLAREFSTHSPVGTGLGYSISCHAKLIDSFFGYLSDDQFFAQKMPFNLVCYRDNDDQTTWTILRFDENKKAWVKDTGIWEKEAAEAEDASKKDHLRKLIRTTKVYDLKSVNSHGWVLTQEDLIGDERNRTRHLTYCLIYPPKALCGEGDMGNLKDGSKADLTEYALKILRSIEFLDDEPPLPEVGAPAETQTAP